jgi:glycosyltransferase involved in cell wall biosynthesis
MSDAAWRNATQPRYSWDVIGEQWLELLDEVAA